MNGTDILEIGVGAVVGSVIGIFVGNYISKKYLEKERKQLEEATKNAQDAINDISEQVDSAVRFVYDSEARAAFDKRLKSINLEEVALSECKNNLKNIEDSVLRQQIRQSYSAQVHDVMREELKAYFQGGIKKMVDIDIDTEFIQRTAKQYVKNEVGEVLEKQVRNTMSSSDFDDAIKDYIDENTSKVDTMIRKAVGKVMAERIDDDLIEQIVQGKKNEPSV